MRWYALSTRPWVEEDGGFGYWGLPPGTIGSVDLAAAGSHSHVFVTSDAPFEVGGDIAATFGDGTRLDSHVPTADEAGAWEKLVGVACQPGWTLLDLLWETLTAAADPDGLTRAKPIMPTHKGVLELHLGGHSLVRSEKLPDDVTTHRAWPNMQRVLQNDYRAIRGRDQALARKWLGAEQRKYRLSPEAARDLLIPSDLPRELPLKPTTTIGDTFVEATDTNLADHTATGPNGGFSWSQIDGLIVVEASSDSIRYESGDGGSARAEIDLSSSDMEVSFDSLSNADGIWAHMSALARLSDSALTAYAMLHRTRVDTTYRLFRLNNGSFTQIGSNVSAGPVATPYKVSTRIDGGSLSGLIDGSVVIGPETDTNITTGLRAGLRLPNGHATWRLDNFEAADLLAGGEGLVRAIDEALGLTGARHRLLALARATAETQGATETASRPRALARRRAETQGIAAAGVVARVLARTRVEAIGLTEATTTALAQIGEEVLRVVSEAVALAEAVLRPRRLARVRSEFLGIAGAVARVGGFASATVPVITSRIRMRVGAASRLSARPSIRMNVPPARR